MNFKKTNTTDSINDLRSKLYQKLTAPIDAMWEQLYIDSSQHYLIEKEDLTMGYCCTDDADCLIQLFRLEEYYSKMEQVIRTLIEAKLIRSASLRDEEINKIRVMAQLFFLLRNWWKSRHSCATSLFLAFLKRKKNKSECVGYFFLHP